ncbi:hypothetical protein [Bacteroides oleiciplenus]|uniref:Uncharacterized protein n=2 Tax=Bacteroides oleiciplenus TaxID=626931 RepID=K9EQC4_9BACE|nr:hypothetical protein [Bacteroides oleiciplenus]EKU91335.1 hypothetical protein HMPREF9447_01525 [Bacteroides oleiciplenus YIT 12058]RGN35286.1 hypothetical protein DXB65_11700 [Bacteroides oleiciplenus]
MKLLLKLREEGCFGNKNIITIKALANWAAKGEFFLSNQGNPLAEKTIEEEMGEIQREEYPPKQQNKRKNKMPR